MADSTLEWPDSKISNNALIEACLGEIAELENKGAYLEGIELAVQYNRQYQSPAIEETLVRLRQLAFTQVSKKPALKQWPWQVPDLFPDHHNKLVEISPERLDLDVLCSAIVHHGALLVRGLVHDQQAIDYLRSGIDRALERYDAWAEGVPLSETTPWFTPMPALGEGAPGKLERTYVREKCGLLTADSPHMLHCLLELFHERGILGIVEKYLGERPAISSKKATLRRVFPDLGRADWHQDGQFLDQGVGIRALNVWLSLSHCGDDAPGMEIIARRLNRIVETGTHDAMYDWTVSSEMVQQTEELRSAVVKPLFEPGDVLFFDDWNLHKTSITPEMTKTRYAVETWFFAPSKYPPKHAALMA